MTCMTCNKDLAECPCADLEQKLEKMLAHPNVLLRYDYIQRIRANIARQKEQKEIQE